MRGTEKQIKWANDIKADAIKTINDNVEIILDRITRDQSKNIVALAKLMDMIRPTLIEKIESIQDAKIFIDEQVRYKRFVIDMDRVRIAISKNKEALAFYNQCRADKTLDDDDCRWLFDDAFRPRFR